jgi:mannose-6-phosphate isomerase-like protein (cupin superfamily)
MSNETHYEIHTDIAFGDLELIDIGGMVDACEKPWFNQSLCTVNQSVVRIGVIEGEFHWHAHQEEDEFFYVLEGRLLIDTRIEGREETVTLEPRQGYLVPRAVVHRTRAPERTVMLMVEQDSVVPTGDPGIESEKACDRDTESDS